MIRLDAIDTIAAISSPKGPAARGIIRLSGRDAWRIALERFDPEVPVSQIRSAKVRSGQLRLDTLRPVLPAMLALWPGPKTYTGEDLVEIHVVGSVPIVEAVLSHVLGRGARLAEPGEFTLRAFLAGRIDLTQAEAVQAVIAARSSTQLEAAMEQLGGGIAAPIAALQDRLLDILAHLEAGLDFTDEADVDPLAAEILARELADAAHDVLQLAEKFAGRDRPDARPRVVLVGPPNAGKSLLFNTLADGADALVSAVAGTTRDYLVATCDCDGIAIDLIDTAGIEPSVDEITEQSQRQRDIQEARADLVLDCCAADTPASPRITDGRRVLAVATKSDLASELPSGRLATSSRTGQGVDRLRSAIAAALRADPSEWQGVAASPRCFEALRLAAIRLQSASETMTLGGGDEFAAVDLRESLDALGQVVGSVAPDEVLDRVFRRFCIGK